LADIPDILARKWTGQQWSISENDYSTLDWHAENTQPKPSLQDIQALSVTVDAEISAENLARRKAEALANTADAFLTALDILTETLADEVIAKLRANSTVWQATPNLTRLNALKSRINVIKAMN
jgi:hypothetical protein